LLAAALKRHQRVREPRIAPLAKASEVALIAADDYSTKRLSVSESGCRLFLAGNAAHLSANPLAMPVPIRGQDRGETAGLAHCASPAANRNPDISSSRCSTFHR